MSDHFTPHSDGEQPVNETWRIIPGYDDRYEVSDRGRVRSWYYRRGGKRQETPKILFQWTTALGYICCKLTQGDTTATKLVHRLVALAFIGPSELEINHIDGIKANNQPDNLQYVTHSENLRHAFTNLGRRAPSGENSGNARLTDLQVSWLRRLAAEGKSNRDLMEIFDISYVHVSNLKRSMARP